MRAFITIFALLTVLAGQAKDITGNDAKRIAAEFMGKLNAGNIRGKLNAGNATRAAVATPKCEVMPIENDGQTMAYVCNYGDNDGFVVVASDDCVSPVLGYADSGKVDCGNIPENMRGWLKTMAAEIEMIKSGRGVAIRTASEATEGEVVVDALVKTTWNQETPYNNLCPTSCPTGCIATAMAQIMNYHQWPEQGVGSNSYQCQSLQLKNISVDFSESKYDWDNMLPTYADNNWKEAQAAAVAVLMRDCGASVNMNYNYGSSGAQIMDACYAGNTYFKYTTAMYYHGNYTTEEFENLMKKELDGSRPMLFTACNYSDMGGGHAYVVDGYRSDGKFHVNWGWSGECDGFYELCLMNPVDGKSFPARQVIGTFAPDRENAAIKFYRSLNTFGSVKGGITLESDFDGDKSSPFTVKLNNVCCLSYREYTGLVGVGLFGEDGTLVKELAWTDTQQFSMANQDFAVAVESGAMADIADGKYYVKAISRETIDGEYLPTQRVTVYGPKNRLDVAISSSNMKISNLQIPLDIELASLKMPEEITLFTNDSIQISLRNNADVPLVARPCLDFKDATDGSIYNVTDSTFVLYDGQQIDLNVKIGFNLENIKAGDHLVKAYLLDGNGDTIHVEGLGEWMAVSVKLDETKVPRVAVSSVDVSEMIYDPEDEIYNENTCDPICVEARRGEELDLFVAITYSIIGDVAQDTQIKFSDKATAAKAMSNKCSISQILLFDEAGEFDLPIEYQDVATGEWKTVEGSPSSIHFKVVESTSINAIDSDTNGEEKFYDINGRKSSRTQKGLKIVVQPSGKVTKMVVR